MQKNLNLKKCRTVGALIKELEKLPKTASTSEILQVISCSKDPQEMAMRHMEYLHGMILPDKED